MSHRRLRYGSHRSQVAELWRSSDDPGPVPIVVLFHGGFWRTRYTRRLMHGLAADLTRRGWAVLNVEYRRVGSFGGGGWPHTFDDSAAAVDHLARLDDPALDLSRVAACGHSAGGHLALWVAARHRLPDGAPGARPVVPIGAAVALAGVVDLVEAAALGLGGDAVPELMGGTVARRPDRYALGSPPNLLPVGVPQLLVHGLEDVTVPPAMSERYVANALAAGDDARYVPLSAVDHLQLIDPASAAWAVTVHQLEQWLSG